MELLEFWKMNPTLENSSSSTAAKEMECGDQLNSDELDFAVSLPYCLQNLILVIYNFV